MGELKTMFMMALPRKVDPDDLAGSSSNNALFTSVCLPVGEGDRQKRMESTELAFDDLKSKGYVAGVQILQKAVLAAPNFLRQRLNAYGISLHTLFMTNVPAPTEAVTWPAEGGQVIS